MSYYIEYFVDFDEFKAGGNINNISVLHSIANRIIVLSYFRFNISKVLQKNLYIY